jgi:GNAT superfamily N-acetyltransferase
MSAGRELGEQSSPLPVCATSKRKLSDRRSCPSTAAPRVGALCPVAVGTRLARRRWPALAAADRKAVSVMTEAAVEVIQAADRMRGLACLTLAFATDPVMRWGWPDPHRYLAYWPQIADAFGGRAFDTGTAHGLEDSVAVALWLAPGVRPDGEAVMGLMRESMDDESFADINGMFEQMDALHPTADHWYLPLTGVDPRAQGRGLGSRLLRHALAICDRDHLPAYLEATSPRNRNLYARHGFTGVEVIQAGSSPPMWAMLREPAS